MTARPSFRCHTCGTVFPAWAPAERHADTHGGARLEGTFTDQPELEPPPRRCRVETITETGGRL